MFVFYNLGRPRFKVCRTQVHTKHHFPTPFTDSHGAQQTMFCTWCTYVLEDRARAGVMIGNSITVFRAPRLLSRSTSSFAFLFTGGVDLVFNARRRVRMLNSCLLLLYPAQRLLFVQTQECRNPAEVGNEINVPSPSPVPSCLSAAMPALRREPPPKSLSYTNFQKYCISGTRSSLPNMFWLYIILESLWNLSCLHLHSKTNKEHQIGAMKK